MVHIFCRLASTTLESSCLPIFTILARNELRRSLGTSIYREAEVRACAWAGLIARVKKPEAIAFRDVYGQLPKRIPNKYRGVPVLDLLTKIKGTDYLKVMKLTVNNALTDLRHFFVWAMRHDHYLGARNPVEGIELEGVVEEHFDSYTNDELVLMFTYPTFLKQREAYPARY